MTGPPSRLSDTELMHVALHANAAGKPQETIQALKEILERNPEHAKALYLLGAVHAEIGMYDDAVAEMTQAVALEPDLLTAHFQLGLLHYTHERYDEAEATWRALDELDEKNSFRLFKDGMVALAAGRYREAFDQIELGITHNDFNEDLNNDMRKVITRAQASLEKLGAGGAAHEQEAALKMAAAGRSPKRLSAYENNDQGEDA